MSALTVPSLCDDMLGRVDTRSHHATTLVPASIVRLHCRMHDQDEVGLHLPEELVKAMNRGKRQAAWKKNAVQVMALVVLGELLAVGALILASAAMAAVR